MNCLLETLASMWILSRHSLGIRPQLQEDDYVQESLEGCRQSLEAREAELAEAHGKMGREAVRRKQQGDMHGAKIKLMERRRAKKRLEKLRHSLTLVDAQIDALHSNELDRELMQALAVSSAALKKAGVGKGVKEAEAVMSELDEQMRESCELTSVLSGPLQDEGDFDVEEELAELMKEADMGVGLDIAAAESNAQKEREREALQTMPPVAVNRQIEAVKRAEFGVAAPIRRQQEYAQTMVSGV